MYIDRQEKRLLLDSIQRLLGILFSQKLQVERDLLKLMWKIEDDELLTLEEMIFLKDQLDRLLSILRVYRERNKELIDLIWKLERKIFMENEKC